MQQQAFTQWLRQQQPTLEKVIHDAAQAFIERHRVESNFGYDLGAAQREAYSLANGSDLCYDRYTTPLAYSLWYQARRMNVFLTHFHEKVLEACNADRPVEIFDLGAGTGCVQLCFGLAMAAHLRHSKSNPMLRIINVDSSPFMLEYLRSYLWPQMLRHYPELRHLPVEYHVYSWSNRQELSIVNPWICASYLFDSSENKEYLESNFRELIRTFNPAKILLLTSAQAEKKQMMQSIAKGLQTEQYQLFTSQRREDIFQGTLADVTALRAELKIQYRLRASDYAVTWKDNSFEALALQKNQAGFTFNLNVIPDEFDLFNPPLRVRREVQLNELQEKAARFEKQPSIITGPAGCGKSVVMTEKIINVLEHYKWQKPLHILVTTFNKSLLKQLRGWMIDLLEERNQPVHIHEYKMPSDGTGIITTGADKCVRIKFIHFEMLPSLVGQVRNLPFEETNHVSALKQIVQQVRSELNIRENTLEEVLHPAFLMEEYHRVIFGLQCLVNKGEEAYQQIERKGRGSRPRLERGDTRKAVYTVLRRYAEWMHRNPTAGHSFIARRQLLHHKLKTNQVPEKFDHVFVDEFQDCTQADFEIMSMLLKDVDNLVIAGDLAQAVHIGKTGAIPRDANMSKRAIHRLKGSYRLPFRICEAIQPLSRHIARQTEDKDGTEEITPYKGAPPGARPLFVSADDTARLAEKIVALKKTYACFDVDKITILETDNTLCRNLADLNQKAETSTILRLKGLEKQLVVWSLQAILEFEKEVFEFAYTIMTRTNCLLVIAVTNDRQPLYLPILSYLREDRIIYWDHQSEMAFAAARNTQLLTTEEA